MKPTYLGIDNGLSGALAFYNEDEMIIYDMPTLQINKRKVIDEQALRALILNDRPAHCLIEKLTPLPRISGLTAFSMGHSEGLIKGILTGFNVPYTLVRPADWKKTMGCPKDKDAARLRASQLMPDFAHNWIRKKDDGRAEAAILALMLYEKYK